MDLQNWKFNPNYNMTAKIQTLGQNNIKCKIYCDKITCMAVGTKRKTCEASELNILIDNNNITKTRLSKYIENFT